MTFFFRISFILFLFPVNNAAVAQQPTAQLLLTRMMQAINDLNYQGNVALYKNGKLDTLKFSHAVKNGVVQERLWSLNSPMREMIRNSGTVTCVFPETRKTIVDHYPSRRSFLMDLPKNLQIVDQHYAFTIAGGERIATLPTKIVHIEPKDNLRYTRKIWINEENFLPLKFELINSAGKALIQAMFSELEVKETIPFEELQITPDMEVRHIHQFENLPFEQSEFVLGNIPEGFEKIFFARRPMRGANKPTDHLQLSDGFSTVSVYLEEQLSGKQPAQRTVGAINSYSRSLHNYRITVMGEVPAVTVRYIADGVRLRKQND